MSENPNGQDMLRNSAELQLTFTPDTKQMPIHAGKLLHELRVQQIEFQIQNDQMRQVQAELEKSRDIFINFFNFAPVGYITLNKEGMINEINLTGAMLLGVELGKIVYHRFDFYIAPEDRNRWYRHFMNTLSSDERSNCELALLRGDNSRSYVQLDCMRLKMDGMKTVVRVVMIDINSRRQAEAMILEQLNKTCSLNNIIMERDMRIIELMHEVNELLHEAGQPPRYPGMAPIIA